MDTSRMMKVVMSYFDATNAEVAEVLGVTESYITHIVNDKREPSLKLLEVISRKMNVPMWLLIMAGEPREMERFLGDGRDPYKEAEMPKEVARFVVSMRASLMRKRP